MARNTSLPLDIKHTLRRDSAGRLVQPIGDQGLSDADPAAQGLLPSGEGNGFLKGFASSHGPHFHQFSDGVNQNIDGDDIKTLMQPAGMSEKVVNKALGERVKQAREAAGLTQSQLATAIGSEGKQSAIAEIEAGRVRRPKRLHEIAKATNTTVEWLLGLSEPVPDLARRLGKPAIISSFDPDAPDEPAGDFHPNNHSGVSTDRVYKADVPGASPVIDTRAGAGPGSIGLPALTPSGVVMYSEDAVLGEILLPGYLQQELSRAPAGRMHWIRVRGDSMEPTLQGGDHVAVDTTDTALGQGGMFVARNGDGEIIVKRLYRIPKSDPPQIEVRSDNATLEPPRIVDADWLTVIGRVVAKIGRIG